MVSLQERPGLRRRTVQRPEDARADARAGADPSRSAFPVPGPWQFPVAPFFCLARGPGTVAGPGASLVILPPRPGRAAGEPSASCARGLTCCWRRPRGLSSSPVRTARRASRARRTALFLMTRGRRWVFPSPGRGSALTVQPARRRRERGPFQGVRRRWGGMVSRPVPPGAGHRSEALSYLHSEDSVHGSLTARVSRALAGIS